MLHNKLLDRTYLEIFDTRRTTFVHLRSFSCLDITPKKKRRKGVRSEVHTATSRHTKSVYDVIVYAM